MKYIFFILLLISGTCYSQTKYYIRADTTQLEKVGGNNELNLLNSTRSRTGAYLKNTLNGRTGFFYAVDSAYISGTNLVLVRGGGSQNVTVPIGSSGVGWDILGNAGTTAGTNFLGTTDNQDVVFKANGDEFLRGISGGVNPGAVTIGPAGSTVASDFAVSIGYNNVINAASEAGIAIGESNVISNVNGTAIGIGNVTTGAFGSAAIGANLKSKSRAGVVVGEWNDSTDAASTVSFNLLNRAFQIGIGPDDANRANAMTVLYNGNVGIATLTPSTKLHINGALGFRYVDGNQASGKVLQSDANGVGTWTTPSTVASSVPINGLTAATGTNTINNGNNVQEWQWNTLAGENALILSTTSTAAASNHKLLNVYMTGANASSSVVTTAAMFTNDHTGTSPINRAVYAASSSSNTGTNYGVYGQGLSGAVNYGVFGTAQGSLATNYGGWFQAQISGTTNTGGYFTASGGTTNNGINIAAGALALNGSAGTSGQVLTSAGANTLPTWTTPGGGGDVTKVGTPVNNQVGVWTGDGTIEGDADLTFDGTILGSVGINLASGTTGLQYGGVTKSYDNGSHTRNSPSGGVTQFVDGAAHQSLYIYNASAGGYLLIQGSGGGSTSEIESVGTQTSLVLQRGAVNLGVGITPVTKLHVSGRFAVGQGADVASAAGAMTLGTDGNSFEITGTNTITLLSNVGWVNGSEVTLMFTGAATLTDGVANSGTDIGMELAGNANFVASADDVITLVLSEIGGVQRWREKSRSVN